MGGCGVWPSRRLHRSDISWYYGYTRCTDNKTAGTVSYICYIDEAPRNSNTLSSVWAGPYGAVCPASPGLVEGRMLAPLESPRVRRWVRLGGRVCLSNYGLNCPILSGLFGTFESVPILSIGPPRSRGGSLSPHLSAPRFRGGSREKSYCYFWQPLVTQLRGNIRFQVFDVNLYDHSLLIVHKLVYVGRHYLRDGERSMIFCRYFRWDGMRCEWQYMLSFQYFIPDNKASMAFTQSIIATASDGPLLSSLSPSLAKLEFAPFAPSIYRLQSSRARAPEPLANGFLPKFKKA